MPGQNDVDPRLLDASADGAPHFDAPNLDAMWPAVALSAFRQVSVQLLGWETKVLSARRWLPDCEWGVLLPVAFGGRSLLAGIFLDVPAADKLTRQLQVLPHVADDHEVGLALGEFAAELGASLVERRKHIAQDISAGVPMLCRGRVDVGSAAQTSALQVSLGGVDAWLVLIRPRTLGPGVPAPLTG